MSARPIDDTGAITPEAAAWLDEASFLQAQRESGQLVGGYVQWCGCGRQWSIRDRVCPGCGKGAEFSQALGR